MDLLSIVSIQLVSPASGDGSLKHAEASSRTFPFNWFPQRVGTWTRLLLIQRFKGFHSIGFPSEWGLVCNKSLTGALQRFPFNWFPQRVGTDLNWVTALGGYYNRFHSIGFPSEWGLQALMSPPTLTLLFPFNWFPQRVGTEKGPFGRYG